MSESDIDPEDELLIEGRPGSGEEDEWDNPDDDSSDERADADEAKPARHVEGAESIARDEP
jgi:hypothetical protein